MNDSKEKLFYFIRPGKELNTGGKHYNHQLIQFVGIQKQRVLRFDNRKMLHLMVFKMLHLLVVNRGMRHVFIFDIVDANKLFLALLVTKCVLSKWAGFVVICHHLEEYQRMDYLYKQFALRFLISGIIAPSRFVASQVKADEKKKKVLQPRFRLSWPREVKKSFSGPDQSVMLLFVGGIVPRKNVVYHLQVLSELPDRFNLTICSKLVDEKCFAECKKYLQSNGGSDRVQFVFDPSDQDLSTWLAESDALLFLSSLEGFGMVNIEAMAHGLPVFASDIGAHRELIDDGESGFLVPLDDARAVADRITSVFENPDIYKNVSENGVKKSKQFVWDSARVIDAVKQF